MICAVNFRRSLQTKIRRKIAGCGTDYLETLSDLLLDEFTETWKRWASSRHSIIRNQAHGSPANIIDLYAASDIPETEGSDIVEMKLASSAAHITGKSLVGCGDRHLVGVNIGFQLLMISNGLWI